MRTTCCWVMVNGLNCGKSVRWHMAPDGGEPGAALVREYEPYCSEHAKKNDNENIEETYS